MVKNQYVDFVTDEHFLNCVKYVCDAYEDNTKPEWHNGRDPFKLIFDTINSKSSFPDWETQELMRQADKTINNRIGEFHQKLLGGVNGWTDLGTGDDIKLDLKKDDNTIFLELKNKFNTVNGDSLGALRRKLENNLETYPNSVNYWAFLISKNGSSNEIIWKYKDKTISNIKKIWGSNVYSLVTSQENALEKTWKAMPHALQKILKSDYEFVDPDGLIDDHFRNAF
ncbi:MAG: Eco47II family restriction endonuclease [Cenarchaeum symbiont of Oopsacas minuta]|nr:Eco47II family restriction endonuclease [Cenarchaeum symbiont of Oopsacas minuta]